MKTIGILENPKKKKNIGRKMERYVSKWVIEKKNEMKIEKLNNVKKRCKKLTLMAQVTLLKNHLVLS
jgi:hypothetical protein